MLPYHCVGMIDVFLLYFVSTVLNLMFIISLLGGVQDSWLVSYRFCVHTLGSTNLERTAQCNVHNFHFLQLLHN